jgi:hypothetical protein
MDLELSDLVWIGLGALVVGGFLGHHVTQYREWAALWAGLLFVGGTWGIGMGTDAAFACIVGTQVPSPTFERADEDHGEVCEGPAVVVAIGAGGGIGFLIGWAVAEHWNADRRRSSTEGPGPTPPR